MGIVRVLKRKDAASVIVAVVLAMIVLQFLSQVTVELANTISGLGEGESYASSGGDWKVTYLLPTVSAALQVIALELLIWVYAFLAGMFKNAK